MTTRTLIVPFKRGSTSQNDGYLGGPGEITVDSQARTLRVHDGAKKGGEALLRRTDLDEVKSAQEAATGMLQQATTAITTINQVIQGATDSATNAHTSEVNAKTSETNASTSKTGADTSATRAQNWAVQLGSKVDNIDYSAKYYANASATSASSSSGSATSSQNWATQLSTEVVTGQGYSAKQYSLHAAGHATTAKNWATQLSTEVVTGQGYSSQQYAINSGNSATLAKAWATQASAEVVTGQGYSAYYWAMQASQYANQASNGQIQASWTETNTSSKAYIIGKPTLALIATSGNKTDIGLGNVDNTSDVNKPISNATQAALNGKFSTAGGTLTGGVTLGPNGDLTFTADSSNDMGDIVWKNNSGVEKHRIFEANGLMSYRQNSGSPMTLIHSGNIGSYATTQSYVDNAISGLNNSKATTTYVDNAISGVNTTLATKATTAYVDSKVAGLVNSAPAALDTLKELADALGGDASYAATTAAALGYRLRFDAAQSLTDAQKLTAKQNISLDRVSNTADSEKPVSTAQQSALDLKLNAATVGAANGVASLDGNRNIRAVKVGASYGYTLNPVGLSAERTLTIPDRDGTLALADDLNTVGTKLVRSNGALTAGSFLISSNWTLTLPDLTSPMNLSLTGAANAPNLPATITAVDGWTVTTGFTVGVSQTIAPLAFDSKHGWWGTCSMSPPQWAKATITTGTVATGYSWDSLQVLGSVKLGNLMIVAYTDTTTVSGSTAYVSFVAIDLTTGAIGASVKMSGLGPSGGANYLPRFSIFATSTTSFGVFVYGYNGSNQADDTYTFAGTLSGSVITLGTGTWIGNTTDATVLVRTPLQLADNLFFMSTNNSNFDLVSVIFKGTNAPSISKARSGYAIGYSVASIAVNSTSVLWIGASTNFNGGPNIAMVLTINATTGAITTGATYNSPASDTSTAYGNQMLFPAPGGNGYLYLTMKGTTSVQPIASWYFVSVSGTTVTFGANVTLNLSAVMYMSSYWPTMAFNCRMAYQNVPYRVLDANRMLYVGSQGQVGMLSVSGTTITLSSVQQVLVNDTNYSLVSDLATNSTYWMYGPTRFQQIVIPASGLGFTLGDVVAGAPRVAFNATTNDVATYASGAWRAWKGVPNARAPLSATQYLAITGTTLETYYNMS